MINHDTVTKGEQCNVELDRLRVTIQVATDFV